MRPQTTPDHRLRARWRATAIGFAAAGLLAGAGVVVASVVEQAEGRFGGMTSNEGSLFSAAVIDVALASGTVGPDGALVESPDAPTKLALDVENMTPAAVADRCLTAVYHGQVDDVTVVLSGRREGEAGLDQFLQLRITTGRGLDPSCADFEPESVVYEGTLADLFDAYAADGFRVELAAAAGDGEAVTFQVDLQLIDDNAAQGLELWYWLTIEAVT